MATNLTPLTNQTSPTTDQSRPWSADTMHLLYEALSRARMRSPQKIHSEASYRQSRGALRVAMESRKREARERAHHWV
jgi:hypothetical protein